MPILFIINYKIYTDQTANFKKMESMSLLSNFVLEFLENFIDYSFKFEIYKNTNSPF